MVKNDAQLKKHEYDNLEKIFFFKSREKKNEIENKRNHTYEKW